MTAEPQTPWPAGKRCAVMIAILFDDGADACFAAPGLADRAKSFSVWRYGAARGVHRLSRALGEAGVPATWFTSAVTANQHPALIREIAGQCHEIAGQGWAFQAHDALSPEQSLDSLRRGREALSAVSGQDVRGFRLPTGDWPAGFDQRLLRAGHDWSASLNGDDVPYAHPSGLVEIPVHIELEDRPYFQFSFTPPLPKGLSRLPDYEGVLANWTAEFDAYRRLRLCYVLQLRPEWSGTPGRISLIETLLAHIAACDDVWLATGSQIADWRRRAGTPTPEDHPINVYHAYVREQRGEGGHD